MEQKINKPVILHEVLFDAAQAMAKASAELQAETLNVPNYSLKNLIISEITNGKVSASAWKQMCPGSSTYTHTNIFPLELFEELPEDFLVQLELSDIYLYKNEEENTAIIKIIFHF